MDSTQLDTEIVRRQMVEQQIRTWGVFDQSVLDICNGVPRDLFVPPQFADVAYADTEIPLPHGQCMLRPSIIGRILLALRLGRTDNVLEIGTGSGYLTACMAEVAGHVTSIDIFSDMIDTAAGKLADVDRISLHCMDAMQQLPEGPFDAIAVTASVSDSGDRFASALKPGGRLFIVIGKSPLMTATLLTRSEDGELTSQALFETDIPAMIAPASRPPFSF